MCTCPENLTRIDDMCPECQAEYIRYLETQLQTEEDREMNNLGKVPFNPAQLDDC